VTFKELEIVRVESGAPELRLHGRAAMLAQALGLTNWSVSLSHSEEYALAFVVATGE
jgi:phosphopantetheine--protein transferase-like protein